MAVKLVATWNLAAPNSTLPNSFAAPVLTFPELKCVRNMRRISSSTNAATAAQSRFSSASARLIFATLAMTTSRESQTSPNQSFPLVLQVSQVRHSGRSQFITGIVLQCNIYFCTSFKKKKKLSTNF